MLTRKTYVRIVRILLSCFPLDRITLKPIHKCLRSASASAAHWSRFVNGRVGVAAAGVVRWPQYPRARDIVYLCVQAKLLRTRGSKAVWREWVGCVRGNWRKRAGGLLAWRRSGGGWRSCFTTYLGRYRCRLGVGVIVNRNVVYEFPCCCCCCWLCCFYRRRIGLHCTLDFFLKFVGGDWQGLGFSGWKPLNFIWLKRF